jgi:alkylation response protein AidB-like acyl-CoA dehydrogenase
MVPPEYGGLGLSEGQFLQFEKEWSKVHGGIRTILHVHSLGAEILQHGTDDQKAAYYPRIARGELSVAFALTEPEAGTGRDIKARARREGDKFILNGTKHLITNADFAGLFNVVCWTEAPTGEYQISNLLVERGSPGFLIRDMKPAMGCVGAAHGRLIFNNCVVPVANILGEEGKGLEATLYTLNVSRVRIAACALGTMERCLDMAVDFAQRRVTFGRPIGERQAVQRYLAEMAMDIYALQCVINDTVRAIDDEEELYLKANLCKLLAIEAGRRVTDQGLLVMGGIGYTREYPMERLYRDLRLNWLEEGTPTIHISVAARSLLDGERTYSPYHRETLETPLEKARKGLGF